MCKFMLQEKIEITNYHKEKLVGLLTTVNNDKKLMIVCHGFALNKEKTPVQELCKAISNQGYNCFRFDFSGCGEIEGEFGSSHYTKQSDDLASVINHFDVDSYKIKGVIGHSMGGSVAILQAARDPRIGFVVAISPRIFPLNHSIIRKSGKTIAELINSAPAEHIMETNGVKQRFLIAKEYFADIARVNIVQAVIQIEVPFLLLHGTEDNIVDIDETRKAFKAASEPKSLIEIKGASHGFNNSECLSRLISELLTWINSLA